MKIQLIHQDSENTSDYIFNAEPTDSFGTFGGEYSIDNYTYSEFGLDLEDVSIHNVSKKQIQGLGVAIINHLLICGYDFEFMYDENGKYLKTKE